MSSSLKSWNLGKGLRDKERRVNCVKSGSTINGDVPFGVVNFWRENSTVFGIEVSKQN